MSAVISRLVHSRKFLVAAFAVVQTIVLQLFPTIPNSIWQSIDALAVVLIAAIAYEDGAEKSATVNAQTINPPAMTTAITDPHQDAER